MMMVHIVGISNRCDLNSYQRNMFTVAARLITAIWSVSRWSGVPVRKIPQQLLHRVLAVKISNTHQMLASEIEYQRYADDVLI